MFESPRKVAFGLTVVTIGLKITSKSNLKSLFW